MANAVHKIRALTWRAHARSPARAFAVRRWLRDRWQAMLLPVLEEEFDKIADDARVVHIAKIELSIRIESEDKMAAALPELARRQLREQLRLVARKEKGAPAPAVRWSESSARQNRFESLLHYLHTGSVPWHVNATEVAIEFRQAFREARSRLVERLIHRDESDPFYFRLLEILSEEESISLVHDLAEGFPPESRSALAELVTFLLSEGRNYFSRHGRLKLAAAFIRAGVARDSEAEAPDVKAAAAKILAPADRRSLENFFSSLPPSVAALFSGAKDSSKKAGASDSAKSFVSGVDSATQPNPLLTSEPSPSLRASDGDPVDEEPAGEKFPLAVSLAGLVLLHPFIPRLFENTAILDSEKRGELSPVALPRAAALLYFVATGREDAHEWELGCIKIMLGLDPATPLPVCEGLLTVVDKDEAQALIESAIGYWSALKNTSVDGLRSSFLQRAGLLTEEADGWRLRVEEKPFDVLLDQLPWSLSMVKLPWMKKPIATEWRPL